MKLEVLLGGLENPQPAVRLDVVRVLGMVDETRALEALRARYQHESDPVVRQAIAWAGKRLYEAQQAGYTTVDEVFRHFGVQREIESMPDAAEAELKKKMDQDLERTLTERRGSASRKQAGLAAAAGLGVSMVAGGMAGLSALSTGLTAGAGAASSSLEIAHRAEGGTQRAPATKPASTDFSIWLRRLRESTDPARRVQAALEIQQLNNPAALPHLAVAFLSDESPQVRQAAQHHGKILYWSAIYWEMEQDGSLAAEMQRRREALGKSAERPVIPPVSAAEQDAPSGDAPSTGAGGQASDSEPDVGDILRRAQQARAKRRKKR